MAKGLSVFRRWLLSSLPGRGLLALLGLNLLAWLIGAGLSRPAAAAGIAVTSAADTQADNGFCTLREAILNANNDNQSGSTDCPAGSGADIITFNGNYTIILASNLPALSGNLTIDGIGREVTISGANARRVFEIQPGGVVTLSHLNIIGGKATSGIFCPDICGGGIFNNGALMVSNSTLSGNSAGNGGGIYNLGTLMVNNSTLSGNSASFSGGGIYNFSGTLTVNQSTLSGNSTRDGGGIYNANTVTINNSTLSGNLAINGGGLYNNFTVTINNSTLSGNSASSNGGGLYNNSTLTLNQSTLSDNSAFFGGGGIYNSSFGMLTINNSTLSSNSASDGGGIYNFSGGTLTVTNSTLSDNRAGSGGGIRNDGNLHLRNTIVANSLAGGDCFGVALSTNTNNLSETGGCGLSPSVAPPTWARCKTTAAPP